MRVAGCPLCEGDGGHLVFRSDRLRVIRASEPGFPAFYRVVWNDHVSEFSDLEPGDRVLCMEAVTHLERVLRDQLAPTKINLAALGNMVPHLHWHVIPRFDRDSHFPGAVWAAPQRQRDDALIASVEAHYPQLDHAIARAVSGMGKHTAP